jgi:uncharacterized protein (TIGR03792 family)
MSTLYAAGVARGEEAWLARSSGAWTGWLGRLEIDETDWVVVVSIALFNGAPVREPRRTHYGFVKPSRVRMFEPSRFGNAKVEEYSDRPSAGRIVAMTNTSNAKPSIQPGMVIEELHFAVERDDVEQFLAVEGRVWTGFLQTCEGFLRKEVWLPEDEPGKVVVMIWWNTMAQWKSITPAQCDEVDIQMGEWLRPITYFKAHHIARVTEGS